MLRPGDILEGKYKILEKIGQGGMSKVWLAMDTKLNKQWAVKEIDKHKEEYKRTVNEDQTLTEIEIMKKLSHPALPRIVSIIDEPGSLCVVMDYIEGESLDKVLHLYGRQPEETVVSWTLDICDVLNYLHHQNPPIIYRDMKPSNVMLSREGNIKIIDFGIAREYKGNQDDTLPLGTRGYASPEHFTKKTDVRSDVYTVGVTMYQLLTGKDPAKPPYKILPLREIDQTLSTGLEKIIGKATKADPEERYQSIEELANAVSSYKKLDDEYIESLKRQLKRYVRGMVLSGFTILLGLGFSVGGLISRDYNYNALLNGSTVNTEERADELKKAIALVPGQEDAYLELIKVYAKDGLFTEDEMTSFQDIYNTHKEDLEKDSESYAKTNYAIGEAILKYYSGKTDRSERARLLAAEPYFSAANVKGFSKKTLASDYVFMAEYYKNYILADDSLVTDEPSLKDYQKLLKKCQSVLSELRTYSGEGKEKMCQITYRVLLNLMDGQRNGFQKAGVPKTEVLNILSVMEADTKHMEDNEEAVLAIQKEIKELRSRINLSYSVKEIGRKGEK